MAKASSKWQLHPDLQRALAEGGTFEEWLGDRRPCCSYARITQDRRNEVGVGRQHRNCDEFAAQHGCAVVYRYTDNHITAADPDIERPAFLRMVRDLRARRVEEGHPVHGLFVVEEERVVRLPEDYLKLHRALTVDNRGLYAVTDTKTVLDVHSDGEMIRGLLNSAMGEREVVKVKRRVRRNVRDQAVEGAPTGPRRFGWLGADKKSGRRVNEKLDPEESPVLRKALEMGLAGKHWSSIVEFLDGSGFLTNRGNRWSTTPVQYMLTNPALCGYRVISGELVRDPKTGEPVVGEWETICTPTEWLKMISRCSVWFNLDGDTASTRYREKVRREGKKDYRALAEATRRFFLTNLARCGYVDDEGNRCYAKMKGSPPSGTNKQDRYRCGDTRCNKVSRRADYVDKAIEELVILVLERQFSALVPDERTWYGEETLTALLAKRDEYKRLHKDGTLSVAEYLEFRDENERQISESQKDRDEFYAEQAAKNFLAGFTREKWKDFDMRQRRQAAATVLQAVIIHPIPAGRSRSAEFDPDLLEPVFRAPY
ncbi:MULTISPECIES: recombinase family protein [unclassified Streptomyces]|uniref:recombinase family protein n=1 Tax=unclassified Streptomyces TaxID=2593676 RepID=UPI00136FD884|nr:recombinase family protein [Streptomyces sp. SID335]MYZ19212.1 recombinase family protein [Streptomyces sp. SID337]NDZ91072.1 recombinase family protein [Streptomyces sp. SID10115]NEA05234.1 recombinase family protein [Streptomyces sp. SID10116]NEB45393.1 recombinase family protein [Streptomyces sp. SID339]